MLTLFFRLSLGTEGTTVVSLETLSKFLAVTVDDLTDGSEIPFI